MRLMVLGRGGQVATELGRLEGHETRHLGRDAADLSDPPAAAAALRAALAEGWAEAVVNAAAWTAVDRAEEAEAEATRVNGDAPGLLAAEAAAAGLPFVHVSTDYVFDGAGAAPFAPGDPVAPLGAYGRSKLAGERAVAELGGAAGWACLRTSWVVSAHGSNFVLTMLRLGAGRPELRVVDDQVGGPTPADAIAAACARVARALAADPSLSGVYHFSGAPDVSWAELARAVMDEAGLPARVTGIPSSDYPTPAARPLNSRLDCSATEAAFGLARPDWRAGLRRILAERGAARPA